LSLFLNDRLITEGNSLNLINDQKTVNKIVCISIISKPDVDLFLFDSQSLISLSDGFNYLVLGSCTNTNVCAKIYQVNFVFPSDSKFDNMKQISCSANNYQYGLNSKITRSVTIFSKKTKSNI
jgi:hypothetical protein